MVMDYWCSLWFWDMRNAEFLPSRQQYLNDISSIINVNLSSDTSEPLGFGFEESTLGVAQTQIIRKTEQLDLFDEKERLSIVKDLSIQNRFFHSQLEFIEVFLEREGFDIIVGNPPWVNVTLDVSGVISEFNPSVSIRKLSAPKVNSLGKTLIQETPSLKKLFIKESIWAENNKEFQGSFSNYPWLLGQRNNLYKSIVCNSINQISPNGYIGLIHPENLFDDPKAGTLRSILYPRLKFHFHFRNELKLFSEVHNNATYGVNVYGNQGKINFHSIFNLFSPSTIDTCFISNQPNNLSGIKSKNSKGEFEWNISGAPNRLIEIDFQTLTTINKLYEEEGCKIEETKLVNIHNKEIKSYFLKLSRNENKISSYQPIITIGYNQTNSINSGILIDGEFEVKDLIHDDFIYSGPNFFVSNPLYKTARKNKKSNKDFDIIDLNNIGENYIPLVNYKFGNYNIDNEDESRWFNSTKLSLSKMLWLGGERTLQPSLYPPKTTHIDGVISISFNDIKDTVLLCGVFSSIVYDFYIKSLGKDNLYPDTIEKIPFNKDILLRDELIVRVLRLNCLNVNYSQIWSDLYNESFKRCSSAINDKRISSYSTINKDWKYETPFRNSFERRMTLVEIDVITAISQKLTLNELILIYQIQFPVLQQNEDDTWYDQKGNIVFTCSKGLTGVGVDRPVWNSIKDLEDGETYEHTIEKSELYYGEKVTYYAPFEKCDRVEDYKIAWEHFEKIFNQN